MQNSIPTWVQDIAHILPDSTAEAIYHADERMLSRVDEVRLRANKPVTLVCGRDEWFITERGKLRRTHLDSVNTTAAQITEAFEAACQHSIYAFEQELRNGFVTMKGGYRVGVSGRVQANGGQVTALTQCSGLCIRVSREIKGCADRVMPVIKPDDHVRATLLISPPMMGKTTLLRDIARQVADGVFGQDGEKVCIVDERGEIAGSVDGVPQLDVGIRTDVLDGCPKSVGIMMALRTLSPSVIVTDEIGTEADAEAILEALYAGVRVIASVHGNDEKDVQQRRAVQKLMANGAFSRYVILGGRPGHVCNILDEMLRPLKGGAHV